MIQGKVSGRCFQVWAWEEDPTDPLGSCLGGCPVRLSLLPRCNIIPFKFKHWRWPHCCLPHYRYAVGGYDGSNMISNVEIFDLCTNSWRICSPLQVTMDDNLFYIGGHRYILPATAFQPSLIQVWTQGKLFSCRHFPNYLMQLCNMASST